MILEAIRKRQSIRSFTEKEPTDDQLYAVLKAASLAPSWVNVQPWHFIAVKNKSIIKLLGQLAHGQPHVAKAPTIIVCCGDLSAWDYDNYKKVLEEKKGITPEKINQILSNSLLNPSLIDKNTLFTRTVEQLSYAIAYMTLEAHNQGLGCCVIGNIGNELTRSIPGVYEEVKDKLKIPQGMFISSLLIIGIPQHKKDVDKTRKDFSEVISFETYSSK